MLVPKLQVKPYTLAGFNECHSFIKYLNVVRWIDTILFVFLFQCDKRAIRNHAFIWEKNLVDSYFSSRLTYIECQKLMPGLGKHIMLELSCNLICTMVVRISRNLWRCCWNTAAFLGQVEVSPKLSIFYFFIELREIFGAFQFQGKYIQGTT